MILSGLAESEEDALDNFSPKTSAEINGIKFENSFNFGSENIKDWLDNKLSPRAAFPMNFISRTRRAINPAKYEANLAEARKTYAQSICDTFAMYKKTMPSLSDNQIFLLASGYPLTPGEADNVTEVLFGAAETAMDEANPHALDVQFKNEFIKGAATAYEAEVRDLWSKLLNSELKKPGSYSKRTMAVLREMSREDAEAFQIFCAYSFIRPDKRRPIPVLTELDGAGLTYNHGHIGVDQLTLLESFGLVNRQQWDEFTLPPFQRAFLITSRGRIAITNATSSEKKMSFGYAFFTPTGVELASICEIGSAPDLLDLIRETGNDDGLTYSQLPL